MTRLPTLGLLLFLALLGPLAGCGGSNEPPMMPVKGRVTKGGAPLQVAGQEVGIGMVQVGFYRLEGDGSQKGTPWEAKVDPQGNFTLFGPSGNGIPPGKYKITVRQWDPYPQTDKLQGQFDEKNSKIVREINGASDLAIDVSKPEG